MEQALLRSAAYYVWTIKMNTPMILYYIGVKASGLQQTRTSVRKLRQRPTCQRFYFQLPKNFDHLRTDFSFENRCHFSAMIIYNFCSKGMHISSCQDISFSRAFSQYSEVQADAVEVSKRNISFSACKLPISGMGKRFSLLQSVQTRSGQHPASHQMETDSTADET
jgi:hypothetical protein